MNTDERKDKFKIALIKANKNMKEFCYENGIDYNVFNHAINGFTILKEDYSNILNEFIKKYN